MNKKQIFLTIASMAALSASTLSFPMNLCANLEKILTLNEAGVNINEIAKEVNIDAIDDSGKTILHLACALKEDKETIELLLKLGAKKFINKTDNFDRTALSCITDFTEYTEKVVKTVELLLENGAKIDSISSVNVLYRNTRESIRADFFNAFNQGDEYGPTKLSKYFGLVKEYDNAENKIQFIATKTGKEYDLLKKRWLNCIEIKNALNLPENTRGLKRFSDCRITLQEQE